MSTNNLKVEWVWVDKNNKQVGVRISLGEGRVQDVALRDLSTLKGRLINALVTEYGVRGKVGALPRKFIERGTGRPMATYTLMHKDDIVCRVFPELGRVELTDEGKLPFALRGIILTSSLFTEWLDKRIDNLARIYMNKVYIARKVGRDREKILRDSCGISPIDSFWICRPDIKTSWEELKKHRDTSISLVNTALTGDLTETPDFTKAEIDTTTLFALKGAFPKAVYKGCILKKDNNAEYEVVAYRLGCALGVSVAEARQTKQPGVIECKLFTSETISMAHARDFLHLTKYASGVDDEHMAVYEYFIEQGRRDIVSQLERLYIFNYLVSNMDLHYENFGLLYDNSTFKVMSVAPCYDFNSAFGVYSDVTTYYTWIMQNLAGFISNHEDIRRQLNSTEFARILESTGDLTTQQKNSISERAKLLRTL